MPNIRTNADRWNGDSLGGIEMRGISEKDVWALVNSTNDGFVPASMLINKIKELNEWKPIDEFGIGMATHWQELPADPII